MRHAWVMKLKPGNEAIYTQNHDEIWPELLELLMKASPDQQVIYLTDDPDVAEWARVEALTGAMSIVEPTPTRREGSIVRRSGHIAV